METVHLRNAIDDAIHKSLLFICLAAIYAVLSKGSFVSTHVLSRFGKSNYC
jgi:hypothetical protein